MGQLALFDRRTIDERFAEFDREHPSVYSLFRRFALELRTTGHARYSADAILHRIRWHYAIKGPRTTPKINDHFSACYARKLMTEEPMFAGFFETRERRSAS